MIAAIIDYMEINNYVGEILVQKEVIHAHVQ